jgi:hypothetical protein
MTGVNGAKDVALLQSRSTLVIGVTARDIPAVTETPMLVRGTDADS